jgi:hypothetical protein
MDDKTNKIITRGDGVQRQISEVTPVPFNFAREVLHQGGFDTKSVRLLVDLSLRDMFPDENGTLYKWNELTPHEAVSILAAYHGIDESMNGSAVHDRRRIKPVKDADIGKRLQRPGGVLSPREVEMRFSPGAYRANIKM